MKGSICILAALAFFITEAHAQQDYDHNTFNSFLQDQAYEQAVSYLQSVRPSAENSTRYQADLGYAYFMNEQYREAINIYSPLYARQPQHLQANLYLAQSFNSLDNTDSALFYYINLTRLQPGNYRYWQRAAILFNQLNETDSATSYFARGYEANPRAAKVLVAYANLLIRQKQHALADTLVNRFLATDTANEEVIAKRMDISFKKADYKTVIYWGEKLWKDSSDLSVPFINLAYSYLNQDRTDRAIAVCQWMMDNNKANQSVLYCAALAHARNKNYDTSNALLDECLRMSIQKDAVAYFGQKADNYEAMKKYTKALAVYDTSYFIFSSPTDLYYAGRIQDKYLNNRTKASFYYRQYLAKTKTPRNSGELKIIEYIKEYLRPVKSK